MKLKCFGLILCHVSGRVVSGSRLLKPGMDGHHAVVLDLSWASPASAAPDISALTIPVAHYEPDSDLQAEMTRAYSGEGDEFLLPMFVVFYSVD